VIRKRPAPSFANFSGRSVRCSALQCVAVRCSAMQCVAVCYSELQRDMRTSCALFKSFLWAVCVSQCAAVCCSVLQCVAVCCSVLQ